MLMAGSILILEATKMLNWRLEFEVLLSTLYADLCRSIPHSLRLVAVQQTIPVDDSGADGQATKLFLRSVAVGSNGSKTSLNKFCPWRRRRRRPRQQHGDVRSTGLLPRSQEKFLKSQQSAWMVQVCQNEIKRCEHVKRFAACSIC